MNTKYNWTNKSKINNEFATNEGSQIPLEIAPIDTKKKKLLLPSEIRLWISSIAGGEFPIVNIFYLVIFPWDFKWNRTLGGIADKQKLSIAQKLFLCGVQSTSPRTSKANTLIFHCRKR